MEYDIDNLSREHLMKRSNIPDNLKECNLAIEPEANISLKAWGGNWQATSTFGTIMYGYSSVGNRIWKNEGGSNLTYNYGTYSKLTSNGSYSYAYDADGNVVWKNVTNSVRYNYLYNSFGQMTEVKKQLYSGGSWGTLATIAKYYYDANGARAKTDESGTISRYLYSGHDPIYYNGTDGKGHKDTIALIPTISRKGVGVYCQQAFGRLKNEVSEEAGIRFKWKDYRPTGGQLALDVGVSIDQVSRSMRHASTQTTERYYCRTRAEPAFANVNEAYNRAFPDKPAMNAKNV
jgi:hypothetical protein